MWPDRLTERCVAVGAMQEERGSVRVGMVVMVGNGGAWKQVRRDRDAGDTGGGATRQGEGGRRERWRLMALRLDGGGEKGDAVAVCVRR